MPPACSCVGSPRSLIPTSCRDVRPRQSAGLPGAVVHSLRIPPPRSRAYPGIRRRRSPLRASEREGFEPPRRLPADRISNAAPSATRTPLHWNAFVTGHWVNVEQYRVMQVCLKDPQPGLISGTPSRRDGSRSRGSCREHRGLVPALIHRAIDEIASAPRPEESKCSRSVTMQNPILGPRVTTARKNRELGLSNASAQNRPRNAGTSRFHKCLATLRSAFASVKQVVYPRQLDPQSAPYLASARLVVQNANLSWIAASPLSSSLTGGKFRSSAETARGQRRQAQLS